jgi:hypothetical protein
MDISRSHLARNRFLATAIAGSLVALGAVVAPAPSKAAVTPTTFKRKIFKNAGGEPNVSISPNGKTVLVDGLGSESPATLYRSLDGGRTFKHLDATFPQSGGGDFDMRWINNTTVVAADLSLTDGIYVDRSTDKGKTWTTTQIHSDVYDRPWLATYKQTVYVIAKGFDGIPYCYVSHDEGRTFDPTPIPVYGTSTNPNPGEAYGTNANAYVDHAMTDPTTGELYILYGIDTPDTYGQTGPTGGPDRLYVAKLDGSAPVPAFTSQPVYMGGAGDDFIDGFNWLAVDGKGTVYVLGNGLHHGKHSTWLSYSSDKGATFSDLENVGLKGGVNVYGSIAAGRPGTLSLVYLRGPKATPGVPQRWHVEMARIKRANQPEPRTKTWRPLKKAIHTKDICMDGINCGLPGFGSNRDLLDYIWNAISPSGKAFAVIASDGPASGGGGVSAILIRQATGPKLGRGMPS